MNDFPLCSREFRLTSVSIGIPFFPTQRHSKNWVSAGCPVQGFGDPPVATSFRPAERPRKNPRGTFRDLLARTPEHLQGLPVAVHDTVALQEEYGVIGRFEKDPVTFFTLDERVFGDLPFRGIQPRLFERFLEGGGFSGHLRVEELY